MESTIGDRIKQLAQAKGFNMSAFSQFSQISKSAISAIMSGKSNPSYDMVGKIAAAFPDVSIEWLMFGSGEMLKSMRPGARLVESISHHYEEPQKAPSDAACWEILKREEAQHELLKKDYAELKVLLRQARIELFLLQQTYNGASVSGGLFSDTPAA